MKIKVGATTYSSIKDLAFSPEADVTGNSLPANEFSADIITDDAINVGATAELYDDLDNLWAAYNITFSEKTNAGRKIIAQSDIWILAKRTKDLNMYVSEPVTDILDDLFAGLSGYSLDSSFTSATISGYVPEQSARERLQWICLVLGAYVKSFGTATIQILPLETVATYIPMDKTYWRPEHNHKDYVTRLRVRAYTYVQGTPDVTDEWITDGSSDYYIQTYQDFTLTNPNVPVGFPSNEVVVKDITIISPSNVSNVMNTLAAYYFNRDEVIAAVVNNWDYKPGEKVTVHVSDTELITGLIKAAVFTFGLEARSTIQVVMTTSTTAGALIIKCIFNDLPVAEKMYHFPVGYGYEVDNPYIDTILVGARYILRPTTAKTSGTMTAGTTEVEVEYETALELASGVLYVVSVDELSGNEVVEIA